jgi:four helix bundle protein
VPIRTLQDLEVFREALDAADRISAAVRRPELARDYKLATQLSTASASVPAQIAEGYGQGTDRHFAHYLTVARGGCNEVQSHLAVAFGRKLLSRTEWTELSTTYDRLGRRITRLTQHLRREDRRERG